MIPAFLITAVVSAATAAGAPQGGHPSRVTVCPTARTAAARLICADTALSALDTKLAAAFRQNRSRVPPAAQKGFLNEQLTWMRQRDQKCGLAGKNAAPLDELRKARECMQTEIEARLVQLQNTAQPNLPNSVLTTNAVGPTVNAPSVAPSLTAAPTVSETTAAINQTVNQAIVLTPVTAPTGSGGTVQASGRQRFQFSVPASGISGTADCEATASSYATNLPASTGAAPRSVIEITPVDDVSSVPIFENDTWRTLLDGVRQAVHARCGLASDATNNSSQTSSNPEELYEVNSSRGLFVAQSTGVNGAWRVETNLPLERKKFQSDLAIQKWIKASELTRNPYFFKDMVVGMIVQLDHKISDHEAVFTRSGEKIFVSGVPSGFVDPQLLVLAGRVLGNKGVVDPSGSEQLMPALDYLGTADCANTCEALSILAAQ